MNQITKQYIEEHTFEGKGVMKGIFFFMKPSRFTEKVPDAKDLDDAKKRVAKRYVKKYNYGCEIGFEIHSNHESGDITKEEIIDALQARVDSLKKNPLQAIEAFNIFDPAENEDWKSPHLPSLDPDSTFQCKGSTFRVVAGDYDGLVEGDREGVVPCTLCSVKSCTSEDVPSCQAVIKIAGSCEANEREDGIPVHFEKIVKP